MSTAANLLEFPDEVPPQVPVFLKKQGPAQALIVAGLAALATHLVLSVLSSALLYDNGWGLVWPINGIVVGLMLMLPRWYWPWIQLGSVIDLSYGTREPATELLVLALANTAEVFLVAFLLPPFKKLESWVQEPNFLARFFGYAVLGAPALTSVPIGLYFHITQHRSFLQYVGRWTLADALGISLWLTVTLALRSPETYKLFHWRALPRTLALLGLTCGASFAIFHQHALPIGFVVMPPLLLVAFELGFGGSAIAILLLAVIVSQATLHGHGPFTVDPGATLQARIIVVQIFLFVCMLFSLPVSIVLLQRRGFELQLRRAYTSMEAAAIQDGLTGVANRRRLDLALETEWRRAARECHPLALLMVDVDYFKLYNDTYGHLSGDDCLRRVAMAIGAVVRRSGDLVARYGGEEFAVLLPGAGERAARLVAEFITAEVAALQVEHGGSCHGVVTVSVGSRVLHPSVHVQPSELLEGADRALYAAKQNGRNRVECYEDLALTHPAPAVATT